MANSETRFRIDAELDKWLGKQAAKAGIAKTSYIIQVLEAHRVDKDSTKHSTTDSTTNSTKHSTTDSTDDSTIDSTSVAVEARLAAIEERISKLESKDSTIDSTIDSTEAAVTTELGAPTATVEPASNETPIEAFEVPPSPHLEAVIEDQLTEQPKTLTKQQFRKKFSLLGAENNEAFGKACMRARTIGWRAPDKDKWFCNQDASKWSNDQASV